MNHFLSQKSAFLSLEYSRNYNGPVFRGNHPLPHQSQATGHDWGAMDATSPGRIYRVTVLSDAAAASHMGRVNCLPYNYFVTVAGMSYTAFMTHAAAQAWADAYGLGEVPPIPAEGVTSCELKPGGKMQELRADLSTGLRSPKAFALSLIELKAA